MRSKVADVTSRIEIPKHTLYGWVQAARKTAPAAGAAAVSTDSAEIRGVRAELRRVTQELDIQQTGRRLLCQEVRARYEFMPAHAREFRLVAM